SAQRPKMRVSSIRVSPTSNTTVRIATPRESTRRSVAFGWAEHGELVGDLQLVGPEPEQRRGASAGASGADRTSGFLDLASTQQDCSQVGAGHVVPQGRSVVAGQFRDGELGWGQGKTHVGVAEFGAKPSATGAHDAGMVEGHGWQVGG